MVRFLEDRRGFCVQFASTYAVMARYLGIPARVATGFTPGTPDATGTYSVTNDDAHAWPEIWLAGLGWTDRFDPTPQTSQPGGSTEAGQPTPTPTPTHQAQPVPTTAGPSPTAVGGGTSAGGTVHQPNPSVTTASPTHHGVAAWVWLLVLVGVVAAAALVALGDRPGPQGAPPGPPPTRHRPGRRGRGRVGRGPRRVRGRGRDVAGVADPPRGVRRAPGAGRLRGRGAARVAGPPLHDGPVRRAAAGPGLGRRGVGATWTRCSGRSAPPSDSGLGSGAQLRVRSAPRQPEPAGWSGWSRRRSPSTKD